MQIVINNVEFDVETLKCELRCLLGNTVNYLNRLSPKQIKCLFDNKIITNIFGNRIYDDFYFKNDTENFVKFINFIWNKFPDETNIIIDNKDIYLKEN